MTIRFVLNGAEHEVEPHDGESALEVLRNRCGIRATKDGCRPQGQCGACLALVDGRPLTTCVLPAAKLDGRAITTLEGVSDEERDLLARSFAAAVGHQCGFCIPGIALRTKALVEKNPTPTRPEIRKALHAHLCRCTGYAKILDAIELYAAARRGEADPRPGTDGRLGRRLARSGATSEILGDRPYVDDLDFPGMLHGALVLSPPSSRCWS